MIYLRLNYSSVFMDFIKKIKNFSILMQIEY